MAGKRTFKPSDWNTRDSEGWATQREFSRRELGERHPYFSLYGPRWLFWLIHGKGWLKLGLALFTLWAIGHGGIPVVSDVLGWVFSGLWYLVSSALSEVGSYVWSGLVSFGSWLASVLGWALLFGAVSSVLGLGSFLVWRWSDLFVYMGARFYAWSVALFILVVLFVMGVML